MKFVSSSHCVIESFTDLPVTSITGNSKYMSREIVYDLLPIPSPHTKASCSYNQVDMATFHSSPIHTHTTLKVVVTPSEGSFDLLA